MRNLIYIAVFSLLFVSQGNAEVKKIMANLSVPSGYPQIPYPIRSMAKLIEGGTFDLIFVRFSEKNQKSHKFDYPYNVNKKLGILTPVKINHKYHKEGIEY